MAVLAVLCASYNDSGDLVPSAWLHACNGIMLVTCFTPIVQMYSNVQPTQRQLVHKRGRRGGGYWCLALPNAEERGGVGGRWLAIPCTWRMCFWQAVDVCRHTLTLVHWWQPAVSGAL